MAYSSSMIDINGAKGHIERVDDLPLLHGLLKQMGIQSIIDSVIKPHGNWAGLSPGWVVTIWALYVLSEQNHLIKPGNRADDPLYVPRYQRARQILFFEHEIFTYRQLDELCSRSANVLAAIGVRRGDRVAVVLPNVPAFLAAYLGALKLGALIVTVNTALKTDEVAFVLNDSGTRVAITSADLREQLAHATLPAVERILDVDGTEAIEHSWHALLAQASPDAVAVSVHPDDPAVILYTSGTTGFPKGAVLSHGAILRNGAACIEAFQLTSEDRVLLALPTFHSFGQTAALNPTLMAGATLLLHRQFESTAVQQALLEQGVTVFFGVPTLYNLLSEQAAPNVYPALRFCISAAAPLPAEVSGRWLEKFGVAVEEGYGLTETCLNTCTRGHPRKVGSIGVPLAGVEVAVFDSQDRPVPPGTLGEVVVRSNNLMLEYWNRPQESAEALRQGWFHTGDIGRMDEDGHCFIVDRSKDMVNVGGNKVYPSEVENRLYEHPAVREAAVFGIPEALLDEQVCACLVCAAGQSVSAEEIQAFCRQTLADFKVPSRIEFVDELPKGRTGKILKRILRDRFASVPPVAPHTLSRSVREIQGWIRAWLAERLAILPADLEFHRPLAEYGLTSVLAVSLAQELGGWLDRPLAAITVWRHPTLAALITYLTADAAAPSFLPAAVPDRLAEPIAVVGMGCRLPQAATPDAFWQLLRDGVDAVTEIPSDRWDSALYYSADPDAAGKLYVRGGAFLTDIEQFDPLFFGMAPREAASLDPQQRLLLEVSWEALEDAGIAPELLNGSQTGVFVGSFWDDYSPRNFYQADPADLDGYRLLSQLRGLTAGRIAYVLGLHGPTLQLDTACSSSLLAVHQACQALRMGECDLALTGGVSLLVSPEQTIALCRMGAVAPDGRCKTFDARADGFGRGEGCVVLVLKRLTDALQAGDSIAAVIRGSAVNHDGRSNGLTVPNGLAQEAVIRQALHAAGVAPAQIQYVEAHGTGTRLGDPIEVVALANVLGEGRTVPLAIGSVKTNIGHLDAAAGIAGLLKVVLSLQHEAIPPHLHFQDPNPHIPWQQLPVTVPTLLTPWSGPQRLAGISAFGMSGTNVHMVVEAAPLPTVPQTQAERHTPQLLCLSAKSPAALSDLTRRYSLYLTQHPDLSLADIAWTAATGRSHFAHRLGIVAESLADLSTKLELFQQGEPSPALLQGIWTHREEAPQVAFLFTGQGSQYAGTGRELYETQALFRQEIDRCAALLAGQLEVPLLELLGYTGEAQSIDRTENTQPALFVLEYALAQLWRSWGVEPELLLGHTAWGSWPQPVWPGFSAWRMVSSWSRHAGG